MNFLKLAQFLVCLYVSHHTEYRHTEYRQSASNPRNNTALDITDAIV